MVVFLVILLIIFCVALGLFVLIQNPKGGGLATGGAGSNMFGVQRTGDVLEKGTWVLLALIVVGSLALTTVGKSSNGQMSGGTSKIDQMVDKTPAASPLGVPSGQQQPAQTAPAAKDTTKK
ncbi:MAG: preprotein translocase subunit SecG [Pedobacter sp.]|nr:preprotein translocase subunit SecG [Pedobacter sp.]